MEEKSGFSPLFILVLLLVPALAVGTLFFRNSERERVLVTQNFLDRGEALIWALEAGARTGRGFPDTSDFLQQLVTETARQAGLAFLAVADASGRIVAHSENGAPGKALPLPPLPTGDEAETLVHDDSDPAVFVITSPFTPLAAPPPRRTARAHDGRHPREKTAQSAAHGHERLFVVMGFDKKPLEEAIARDFSSSLRTTLLVTLLAAACFLLLLLWHASRQSKQQLGDIRARAARIVSSLPLGLITVEPDGSVSLVNERAAAMLGLSASEAARSPLHTLGGLDWEDIFTTVREGGAVPEAERLLREDVPAGWLRLCAVPMPGAAKGPGGCLFILQDINRLKALEEDARRSERLRGLGNLAAGVAHEIRNPLSTIKGLATYLAGKVPSGGRQEEAARTLAAEADRLDRVVSRLLEFARPARPALRPGKIADACQRALRLAESDINAKSATAACEYASDLPAVAMNEEQITQVVLNLLLNALQAIPAGGSVHIRARTEGAGVRVTVADNGPGIAPGHRDSIFTPYFTTKAEGTGLGLSICHQIMSAHGGSIRYAPTPGGGATFILDFPLSPDHP